MTTILPNTFKYELIVRGETIVLMPKIVPSGYYSNHSATPIIGTIGDHNAQKLVFERPGFEDCDLVLIFEGHPEQNLLQGNEFTLTNALTQNTLLHMQVQLREGQDTIASSQVVSMAFRQSLSPGDKPVEPLPNPVGTIVSKGVTHMEYADGSLNTYNQYGQQLESVEVGGLKSVSAGDGIVVNRDDPERPLVSLEPGLLDKIDMAVLDDGTLVKQDEFAALQGDYASYRNLAITNGVKNVIGTAGWQPRNIRDSVIDMGDFYRHENISLFDEYNYIINYGAEYQAGDKVYVKMPFRYHLGNNVLLDIRIGQNISASVSFAPGAHSPDVWIDSRGIFTAGVEGKQIGIFEYLKKDGGTIGNYIDVQKNAVAINLTSTFGAGNEPTKGETDALISVVPGNWWDGVLKPSQKLLLNWQLKLIRQNRNAIIALGGTII